MGRDRPESRVFLNAPPPREATVQPLADEKAAGCNSKGCPPAPIICRASDNAWDGEDLGDGKPWELVLNLACRAESLGGGVPLS